MKLSGVERKTNQMSREPSDREYWACAGSESSGNQERRRHCVNSCM